MQTLGSVTLGNVISCAKSAWQYTPREPCVRMTKLTNTICILQINVGTNLVWLKSFGYISLALVKKEQLSYESLLPQSMSVFTMKAKNTFVWPTSHHILKAKIFRDLWQIVTKKLYRDLGSEMVGPLNQGGLLSYNKTIPTKTSG